MKINFILPVEVTEYNNFSVSTEMLEGATPSNCMVIKTTNASHDTLRVFMTLSKRLLTVSICDSTGPRARITINDSKAVEEIHGSKCEVSATKTKAFWGCHQITYKSNMVEVFLYDTDMEQLLAASISI